MMEHGGWKRRRRRRREVRIVEMREKLEESLRSLKLEVTYLVYILTRIGHSFWTGFC
jgi:hypothetical protein